MLAIEHIRVLCAREDRVSQHETLFPHEAEGETTFEVAPASGHSAGLRKRSKCLILDFTVRCERKGRQMTAELLLQDVIPTVTGQCTHYTPLAGSPAAIEGGANGEMLIQVGQNQYPFRMSPNRLKSYVRLGRSNVTLFYVNGMKTTGELHMNAARHLATIANQDVIGVFCPTVAWGAVDFLQCIADYTLPVGRTMSVSTEILSSIMSQGARFFSGNPRAESILIEYGKSLLWSNPSSRSLFEKLWAAAKANQKVVIVCHSQGNLITANSCWVLKKLREPEPMGKITVLGLASPNPSWPPTKNGEFDLKLFRDKEDPVTLLSIPNVGRRPTSTPNYMNNTGLSSHGVHLYLSHKHFQEALYAQLKQF